MIELKELSISYKHKTILQAQSLELDSGQFIALIGRNGSGKSSLLRTLSKFQAPTTGDVLINGQAYQNYSASAFARILSIVNTSQLSFPFLNIRELVSLGRHPHLGFAGRLKAADQAKIDEAIAICGLEALSSHKLAHASDGERQKAMLARALAQDTPIMLLDEITAHLDFVHRHQSFQLLQKLAREQEKLIIMATHEVNLALKYADKILLLHDAELHYLSAEELKNSALLNKIFEGFF